MYIQKIDLTTQNPINPDEWAIEIWCSGCTIKCPECHNKDLWVFKGEKLCYSQILEKIKPLIKKTDTIVLLGGEWLDQCKTQFNKLLHAFWVCEYKVVIYTGYTEKQVRERNTLLTSLVNDYPEEIMVLYNPYNPNDPDKKKQLKERYGIE